jgi:hypothetical protein
VQELGEVGLVNGDDLGVARGAYRGRSRRTGQQRDLAKRVAAPVLADHGVGALINGLAPAARTTYISSARSRSRNSHFPAARRRVRDFAASCPTSCGSMPENSV